MTFKATIARLRAVGVPDAAIPAVMEMLDEREAEARRPRTGTERSRACRERQRNESATKTLQDRSEIVAPTLPDRCADVAPNSPLACAFSMGEENNNIPPEKATLSTPKGEKQKSDPRSRGCRLPEDWRPSDEGRSFAVGQLGSNAAAHAEFANFRDHFLSKSGADARKVDWDAAWRKWVRKSLEIRARAGPPSIGHQDRKPTISDVARIRRENRQQRPDDDLFTGDGGGVRLNPLRLLSSN